VVATDEQVVAAPVMLAARLGKHRLYMLGSGAAWFKDVSDVPAARLGVQVVAAEDWPGTPAKADRLARRIRAAGVDAVMLNDFGGITAPAGPAIDALRRVLGPSVPLIGVDTLPVSDLVKYAGAAAATGIYVVTESQPAASLTDRGRTWLAGFAATQPGGVASAAAPQAAQATEVLLRAIEQSDGTRRGVTAALRRVRVTDGILPAFGFSSTGDLDPARISVLRVDNGDSAAGSVQPDFAGASIEEPLTVLPFSDGLVPTSGTPIRMTTAQTQWNGVEQCGDAIAKPCHNAGTFRVDDPATAGLICPGGKIREAEWNGPPGGIWTIARRTLTCANGAGTLELLVKRFDGGDIVRNRQSEIGESWVITGGTKGLAHLRGNGTMIELWDHSRVPNTLGGDLSGIAQDG
jgi:hypothetical protein